MISVVGRGLLVNVQIRDTLIIFEVAGNKRQMMVGGCGCNEEIRLVNELAFSSKLATHACILFGNRAGNA